MGGGPWRLLVILRMRDGDVSELTSSSLLSSSLCGTSNVPTAVTRLFKLTSGEGACESSSTSDEGTTKDPTHSTLLPSAAASVSSCTSLECTSNEPTHSTGSDVFDMIQSFLFDEPCLFKERVSCGVREASLDRMTPMFGKSFAPLRVPMGNSTASIAHSIIPLYYHIIWTPLSRRSVVVKSTIH